MQRPGQALFRSLHDAGQGSAQECEAMSRMLAHGCLGRFGTGGANKEDNPANTTRVPPLLSTTINSLRPLRAGNALGFMAV
jgi:hypothetical protein